MKKCTELSQVILKAYNERSKGARQPKIQIAGTANGLGEGFELAYAGGVITVRAQSPLAELYAITLLNVAVPGGHWREFLGASEPRFSLRPLWLQAQPASEADFRYACARAAELGYNALICDRNVDWTAIPAEYGLKSIALSRPGQEEFFSAAGVDYFFHEGAITQPEGDLTLSETVVKDVQRLEKTMPAAAKLIYFVPFCEELSTEQSAHVILSVQREAAKGTIVAFSALAGNPLHDYLEPHPIWEKLRSSPTLQGTALMPILNAGGVFHGEGLWPGVCFELADLVCGGCRRHAFTGSIAIVNQMPPSGGFLEANLWVVGQTMWRETPPLALFETWLKANKPEGAGAHLLKLLKVVREVIVALGRLQLEPRDMMAEEERRIFVESVLARLRLIEAEAADLSKRRISKPSYVTVGDYLSFFVRDSKRVAKMHLPAASINDDAQESVWTKPVGEGGQKPVLLDRPNPGFANSKVALINAENRAS